MRNNFRKMSPKDLLTNVYGSVGFRNDFYKWTRIGGFPFQKREVSGIVVDYEHHIINKYESHWFIGAFLKRFDYVDLPMWIHTKLIKEYMEE